MYKKVDIGSNAKVVVKWNEVSGADGYYVYRKSTIDGKWETLGKTTSLTYADKTSRRISFEYAMIKGVNDTPECARELSKKLKGFLCHVNLIPANEVPEKGHERSDDNNINAFKEILEKNGLAVTIRRTLGSDINASCGQLRREKLSETRGERSGN